MQKQDKVPSLVKKKIIKVLSNKILYLAGLLNLGITDVLGQIILCCRSAVLCNCRMVGSIPGFHPLDVRSIPNPSYDNPKYLQTWPKVPGARVTPS